MRLLWSLPKAAPAILRHLVSYAELAAEDLAQTQRDLQARLLASCIVAICLFFAILTACMGVIALTWDTPHRVSAIGWMGFIFVVAGIIAGLYRSRIVNSQAAFLSTVRREWAQDRVIVERILSEED